MKHIRITLRDPLIARDSRPFAAGGGNRMRPAEWIYPSVAAGSFRTMLGKAVDPSFPDALVQDLKKVRVHGPVLERDGIPYFPAPADAVFLEDRVRVLAARPMDLAEREGTDLPGKLLPAMLDADEDFKPARAPKFWSRDRMAEWLLSPENLTLPLPAKDNEQRNLALGYLDEIPADERWHVKVDNDRNAAQDERLFLTTGLNFPEGFALAMRCDGGGEQLKTAGVGPRWHPIGGERRLAHWAEGGDAAWQCPTAVTESLTKTTRVRMVLATPALFQHGWRPGWLNEDMKGKLPGTEVETRLVAVCGERWRAISGYSLERGRRGFKPIRRMAPAGNVYFFELDRPLSGDEVQSIWLWPVSEATSEFHDGPGDGFGLALWGVW